MHVETRAGSHSVCVTAHLSTEHSGLRDFGIFPAHPLVCPSGAVAAHVELWGSGLCGHLGSHPFQTTALPLHRDGQHSQRARTLILP